MKRDGGTFFKQIQKCDSLLFWREKCNPRQIMKTGNFVFLKRSLYSNTKWKNIHFFNFRESEKLTNYCKKPDAVNFLKDLWK